MEINGKTLQELNDRLTEKVRKNYSNDDDLTYGIITEMGVAYDMQGYIFVTFEVRNKGDLVMKDTIYIDRPNSPFYLIPYLEGYMDCYDYMKER